MMTKRMYTRTHMHTGVEEALTAAPSPAYAASGDFFEECSRNKQVPPSGENDCYGVTLHTHLIPYKRISYSCHILHRLEALLHHNILLIFLIN